MNGGRGFFFEGFSPLYQPLQLIMLISFSELNSGILLVFFFFRYLCLWRITNISGCASSGQWMNFVLYFSYTLT